MHGHGGVDGQRLTGHRGADAEAELVRLPNAPDRPGMRMPGGAGRHPVRAGPLQLPVDPLPIQRGVLADLTIEADRPRRGHDRIVARSAGSGLPVPPHGRGRPDRVRCATPLNRRADTTRLPTTLTTVCLLVFAWQTESEYPLVVAANRDERLDRPARSLVVLRPSRPRVLGGLDEIAGGTWLAVNERGVVAGLTNRPAPGGRDLTKRSRGELPLMVAEQRSADEGVSQLLATVRGGDYNPAWLLIGDRQVLYYVELAADQPPTVHQLAPGVHVLENVALGGASVKADR